MGTLRKTSDPPQNMPNIEHIVTLLLLGACLKS